MMNQFDFSLTQHSLSRTLVCKAFASSLHVHQQLLDSLLVVSLLLVPTIMENTLPSSGQLYVQVLLDI